MRQGTARGIRSAARGFEEISLNNNRGSNNRRRGRGGNRQQGGQQINRIDSRARGNAPQLLDKYKKLAHDAHLNGDRVQEEYYLQFADHYFRVLADQKQRQEEGRQPRRDDRAPDYGDDSGPDDDRDGEGTRSYHDREPRSEREQRPEREPRRTVEEQPQPAEAVDAGGSQDERSIYEPAANPFVRDTRNVRGGLKQRRPRRAREEGEEPNGEAADAAGEPARDDGAASAVFDPETLPPSISTVADEKPKRRTRAKAKAPDVEASEDGEEKPKRRRTRKATSAEGDGAGSTLEAVD
jgi:hypothetical protein